MNGQNREDVFPGRLVDIILKKDQRTGKFTRGYIKDILTNSAYHSRGIKVRLESGQIGRVQRIIGYSKILKRKMSSSQVFHTNGNASLLPY